MTLANVTDLSDDEQAQPVPPLGAATSSAASAAPVQQPQQPSTESAPKRQAAKAKAKAKGKSQSAPKAKAKGSAKTKAKARAKSSAKAKPKTQAMRRPAAQAELDDDDERETSRMRPATALKVNKYIYHRDGVSGIKVNGRELMRVRGVSKRNSFVSPMMKVIFISSRFGFDSVPQVKPAEGVSDEKLQEIAASQL